MRCQTDTICRGNIHVDVRPDTDVLPESEPHDVEDNIYQIILYNVYMFVCNILEGQEEREREN